MRIDRNEERERAIEAFRQVYAVSSQVISLYDHFDEIRQQGLDTAAKRDLDYHLHGLCAVLGYNPESHLNDFWRRSGEDLFSGRRKVHLGDSNALDNLIRAMEEDGATLIDSGGYMAHSGRRIGVYIDKIFDDNREAERIYDNLRDTFDAGTRHMAAIAASVAYPELTMVIVKSDYPQIRVIKDGYIVHSTIASEVNHPQVVNNPQCNTSSKDDHHSDSLAA